ncbi:MAG: hypothetical protein LBU21_09795, partial [Treponema sp.]|nr:hypothetical protein [Treponema sp.]
LVSRPCDPGELKALARSLRDLTLSGGGDGRIDAGPGAVLECPAGPVESRGSVGSTGSAWSGGPCRSFRLWGLSLRAGLPLDAGPFIPPEALVRPFPAPVLCAALLDPVEAGISGGAAPRALPAPPVFSFRAASVANLIWRPRCPERRDGDAGGFSAVWESGGARWLPAC